MNATEKKMKRLLVLCMCVSVVALAIWLGQQFAFWLMDMPVSGWVPLALFSLPILGLMTLNTALED